MSGGAAFSRRGAFALVAGGFALFLAILYLTGAGEDVGGEQGSAQAHASSRGLNGYAGLVRLVEAQGYTVDRSRNRKGLETEGLLVLTPPAASDAEEIGTILAERRYHGPTLVIMPKWQATPPSPTLPPKAREKFKRGWVTLANVTTSDWTERLPSPFGFAHASADPDIGKARVPGLWQGMGKEGSLPTPTTLFATPMSAHDTFVTDGAARVLAFVVTPELNGEPDEEAYPVAFLAEPDLANNFGLADPARAAVAVALVDELTYGGDIGEVTFDMTLNGFGASENLLTLAFRPPFLAATLSMLAALLIVGWRAFMRFGPPAAANGPDIAFGKRQLILNGAGLILRARRFGLLGVPYTALSARRLAERLGLSRPDWAAIDAALSRRLPMEEPFTHRAARMDAARTPADILAAAQSLDDLNAKLQQGQ